MDESKDPRHVEVLISGTTINDTEVFTLPDEKAARVFARTLMAKATELANPKPKRVRTSATNANEV